MPLSVTNTFAPNTPATAASVNQNFDDVEAMLDGTFPLNELADGTSGQLIVCNGSGVPTYVAMSGDATISNTGAVTLAAGAVDSSNYAPTVGVVRASNSLGLTGSVADILGTSQAITPTVPSKLLVTATFAFRFENASAHTVNCDASGYLNVDTVNETATATAEFQGKFDNSGVNPFIELTASQHWVVSLTAAAHTIKLQANATEATGSAEALATRTSYSYFLVAA